MLSMKLSKKRRDKKRKRMIRRYECRGKKERRKRGRKNGRSRKGRRKAKKKRKEKYIGGGRKEGYDIGQVRKEEGNYEIISRTGYTDKGEERTGSGRYD